MAISPHQPESLIKEITRLKAELASYRNARDQILAIGQSSSGGGTATTYAELQRIEKTIARLQADIAAFTDQLNGDTTNIAPGTVLLAVRSEYA
jgi:uncharacterized small protein (DUF1192 family)